MADLLFFRRAEVAGWIWLDLAILLILSLFLFHALREDGWYVSLGNRLVIGLYTYFFGITLYRFWQFYVLILYEQGRFDEAVAFEVRWGIGLWTSAIAIIGAACFARVFAPARWGHWTWIIGLPAIVTLSFLTAYLST